MWGSCALISLNYTKMGLEINLRKGKGINSSKNNSTLNFQLLMQAIITGDVCPLIPWLLPGAPLLSPALGSLHYIIYIIIPWNNLPMSFHILIPSEGLRWVRDGWRAERQWYWQKIKIYYSEPGSLDQYKLPILIFHFTSIPYALVRSFHIPQIELCSESLWDLYGQRIIIIIFSFGAHQHECEATNWTFEHFPLCVLIVVPL